MKNGLFINSVSRTSEKWILGSVSVFVLLCNGLYLSGLEQHTLCSAIISVILTAVSGSVLLNNLFD